MGMASGQHVVFPAHSSCRTTTAGTLEKICETGSGEGEKSSLQGQWQLSYSRIQQMICVTKLMNYIGNNASTKLNSTDNESHEILSRLRPNFAFVAFFPLWALHQLTHQLAESLFNRVTRGVMYTREEAEGKRLKNPFDTITEGIGINRLTDNFRLAKVDGVFRGTDREAVEMSRFLLRKDGLFLGSSSAMNCVGAVRLARLLGPGHTVLTILCDSGACHLSEFQNLDYLAAHGLTPAANELEFLDM